MLGLLAGPLAAPLAAEEEAATPPQQSAATAAAAETQTIAADSFAEHYGVRVTQIAVTAAGGMIDLRFKVLDPEKARPLFPSHADLPELIATDSGLRLTATKRMMHNIRIQKDAVSFVLYPNVRNAIHPGSPVSVAFGQLRLEPTTAQ
jgi:hypothetical protein